MGPGQDIPQKRENVTDLILDFTESTTMHGVSRAVGRSRGWKRFIWSALVIAASGVALYNFIEIVRMFETHPESTTITLQFHPTIQFPAVTICNLNRMRNSKLPWDDDALLDILHSGFENKTVYDERRRELHNHLQFYGKYDLYEMGHDIKTMLQDCSFDGYQCVEDDFRSVYNHEYGRCHTFNHGYKSEWNTSSPGQARGLSLLLSIEQREYTHLTPMAGFKVLIHNINEVPFPEEDGLTIGPGFVTSIGIRRAETHRLPAPYGDCVQVSYDENRKVNMYSLYGYNYTQAACKKTCFEWSILWMCDCCLSSQHCPQVDHYGNGFIRFDISNVSVCKSNDTYVRNCIKEVTELSFRDDLECSERCRPECDRVSYRTALSTGTKFTTNYAATFDKWYSNGSQFFENNLVQLDIYYEQLSFESTTSRPAYDWSKLLSDTGGQMGLWLGFSLMTAVEMLELLIDLAMLCYRKLHNAYRKGNAVEEIN